MKILSALLVIVISATMITIAHADTVNVKYRGMVDLSAYSCNSITRSSFIRRVCFNQPKQHMVIKLNGTYYEYCRIDGGTVNNLLGTKSMGRFYNSNIKSRATGGKFDCN